MQSISRTGIDVIENIRSPNHTTTQHKKPTLNQGGFFTNKLAKKQNLTILYKCLDTFIPMLLQEVKISNLLSFPYYPDLRKAEPISFFSQGGFE